MNLGIPEDLRPLIGHLVAIIVIVVGAVILYVLSSRIFSYLASRKGGSDLALKVIQRGFKVLLFVLALFMILQHVGVLENAWAMLSAILAMLAIGFVAVWSVLSNALCTIMLLIVQPFRIGDTLEMVGENVGGKVIDLNLLFTTLRAPDGDLIQIPNNAFFQRIVRRRLGDSSVSLDEQLQKHQPTE